MAWQHLEDTRPMARKEHACYLCGRPIAVGQRHVRRVGTDSGEFVTTRMHEACEALTTEWIEWDWECHDQAAFREYELGEPRCVSKP